MGGRDAAATDATEWALAANPAEGVGGTRVGAESAKGRRSLPAGRQAVEWFLLSNVAVESTSDAWERVDWYCVRWVIEEYHKAQKTGCTIEDPQFTTVEALEPTIALLSVIAITLLNLRDMSRSKQMQDLPATEVVNQEEMEILCGHYHKKRRLLTVREFFLLLARLGGHQNRKKDHPPGWLVLWRGWQACLPCLPAGRRQAGIATDGRWCPRSQRPQRLAPCPL